MKKRILAVVLALTMTIGLLPQTNYAQETNGVVQPTTTTEATTGTATDAVTPENGTASDAGITYNTGLVKPEYVQIHASDAEIAASSTVESARSRATDSYWDKFESNYYYNQLSATERMFYDNLDAMCYSYLTSTQDIVGYSSSGLRYSGKIETAGITDFNKAADVFQMFKYANPQYYFIGYNFGPVTNSNDEIVGYAFQIYSNFINGSSRSAATANMKNVVDGMIATIQAQSDKLAMEKKVHDLINASVSYDSNYSTYSSTYGSDSNTFKSWFRTYEENAYTQSAYSVFCGSSKMTVCAGYALSFELLCNAVGIDTIAITSDSHAWDAVRQNGNWYYVDCTWDDQDSSYRFFNRNSVYIKTDDSYNEHQAESFLIGYLPNFYSDSKATYTSIGTISAALGTAATPNVSLDTSGKLYITSSQPNAKFYYTKDGTDPSVSDTKCYSYNPNNRESMSSVNMIRAIAACDGYNDSSFAGIGTVAFNSNGGTTVASRNVATGSLITQPTNPTKSGYSFMGWYKDPAYTSVWNFASDTVNGSVTLYARWGKTYKIKYNLNGGTQNKLNPSKYTPITNTFALQSPTRKGYTFGGWYKDQQLSKKITKVKIGTKGDLTLYAKWNKVNVVKGTIKSVKNQTGLKVAVTVAKVSGAAGYQISYSTKSNMKSAKSVKVTTTSATIQNLTKKKTYYVQIRPYKLDSTGNKVYGAWSDTKSVKIKK